TTELPIMEVVPDFPQLKFILGLQEAVVVAMADGFCRASGKLAAANVHVAPGLGNAMGALFNAKFSGSPIILTAAKVALTPPTGPVFISLPGDVLDQELELDMGKPVRVDAESRPSDAA